MERDRELLLLKFMERSVTEDSIGMPEICVFAVLFQLWVAGGCENPIRISRAKVMILSKVKSKTTYHKCIAALVSIGYIRYEASYHPLGSWVWILEFDEFRA